MKNLILALVLVPLLALSGCAVMKTPHPVDASQPAVAASGLDLETYNLLYGVKILIDGTKAALAANSFDAVVGPQVKVALDQVIVAYDQLEAQYESYHNAIVAGVATAVQAAAVKAAIPAVKSAAAVLNAVVPPKSSKAITSKTLAAVETESNQPIDLAKIPFIGAK